MRAFAAYQKAAFWAAFVFWGRSGYYCAPVEEWLMVKLGVADGAVFGFAGAHG